MKILNLNLNNYCQHENIQVGFDKNLIGIVGPIGSGKSNLVKALSFSITGESQQARERLITLGAKSGSVETKLSVRPGLDLTIIRDLKRKRAILKFSDGRHDIEGADPVNAAILTELGVDKSILREVVFVGQSSLSDLLFSSDSIKDRMAAKLFGLDRAPAIEKDLSNSINSISLLTLAEPLVDLQKRHIPAIARRLKWLDALAEIGTPDTVRMTELQTHLAAYLAAGKQDDARRDYLHDRRELETKIAERQEANKVLEASIAAIPVERLREKLNGEMEKDRLYKERETLTKDLARFSKMVKNVGDAPYSEQHFTELRAEIIRLSGIESVGAAELGIRKSLIEEIHRGSECPACPVCDEALTEGAESRLQSLVNQTMNCEADKARLVSLKTLELDEINKWNDWRERHHTASSRLQEARQGLEALGEDLGPGDPSRWEKNLASYDQMREDLARGVQEVQGLQKKLSGLIEPTSDTQIYPDGFDPAAAQSEIGTLQKMIDRTTEANQELRLAENDLDSLQTAITKAQAVEKENLIQTKLKAALNRIRARFHPDGAPKELVGKRIHRMEEKINEYLELLESKFTVVAEEGFNFSAIFPDKPGKIMATELSGGQKASLSIAFRLAAIESFSSSVGLLVLDEPTAAFDRESVAHFTRILDRLKAMAPQLGFQFLVISHAPELLEHYDQVIDLTPA